MKSVVGTVGLVLVLCGSVLAQAGLCPKITLVVPNEKLFSGMTVPYSVRVDGAENPTNLKYIWTVERGKIILGQGTPTVEIEVPYVDLTVTVEVIGLPETCQKSAEKTSAVYKCALAEIVDEYEKSNPMEEKARLDNVVFRLKEEPHYWALFILYFPKSANRLAVESRIAFISRHISKVRGIPLSRFKFVFAEDTATRTRVYLVPPDVADESYGGVDLDKFRPPK